MKPPRIQPLPSGKFRVQVKNKLITADKVFDTLSAAEAFRAELMLRADKDSATFRGFTEAVYMTSEAWFEAADNTRLAYRSRLAHLLPVLGGKRLADITQQDMHQYRALRVSQARAAGKKCASDTLRLEFSTASAILTLAAELGYIKQNPMYRMKRPGAKQRTRRVAVEESLGIEQAAFDRSLPPGLQKAALFAMFQLEVGCRGGEPANLPLGDINLAENTMRAALPKSQHEEWRVLSVNARKCIIEVIEQFKPRKYLFESTGRKDENKGQPVPYHFGQAAKLLKKHDVTAEGYHSHANRREFVSDARDRGYSADDIAEMTGQSPATVRKYIVSSPTRPVIVDRVQTLSAAREADRDALQLQHKLDGTTKKLTTAQLNEAQLRGIAASRSAAPAGDRAAAAPVPAGAEPGALLARASPEQIERALRQLLDAAPEHDPHQARIDGLAEECGMSETPAHNLKP